MPLVPGTRLGSYEILSAIGAGGMGEVYRARDTKLDRDVAIKVLPEAFTLDSERIARFEREAKTLATLNHPHIAQIYGVEEHSGIRALVMELVDGETLADRLRRGAIALEEALPIARQIAEALEAAHERGIIHRDLKPANIKLRTDGAVKVLDFGLAKALEAGTGSGEPHIGNTLANSPTITSPVVTHAGVILGTAAYMSPEQAKGRPVDRRTDIWAFGCVVYEMLTGRPPFAGETVTDVLARVIEREPDWRLLGAAAPPSLRRMLQRCLQKHAAKRWHHIGDVALELDAAAGELAEPAAARPDHRPRWREGMAWAAALVMAAIAGVMWSRAGISPPVTSFEISAPPGQFFGVGQDAPFAVVSPDGRQVVFRAGPMGQPQSLWIRGFDDTTSRALPDTSNAILAFWSPDSRAIAFSRAGRLYRLDLHSGASQVICDLPLISAEGGAWGESGSILFGSEAGGIYRVAASGGVPQAVTAPGAGEVSHHWPVWLPGERYFLYRADSGSVFRASLDGATPHEVLDADSRVEYVEPGLLLFARGVALVVQPFDATRGELTGEPSILAESVRLGQSGRAMFSARPDALLYRTGVGSDPGFTWDLYRDGKVAQSLPLKQLRHFSMSPDGTQIAVHTHERGTVSGELSLVRLSSGAVTPLSSDDIHYDHPVWSPDGARLAVTGDNRIVLIRADSTGTAEMVVSDRMARPTDWAARGDWLVYHRRDPATVDDIWAVPLAGDRKPRVVVRTRFMERNGVVSPDGDWLAYTSNESGRPEVYVQRFPDGGGKTAISRAGGSHARWAPNGAAMYYWTADQRVMRVPIRIGKTAIESGAAEPVLSLENDNTLFGMDSERSPYILGPKGVGFIGAQRVGEPFDPVLKVVLNWRERFERHETVR